MEAKAMTMTHNPREPHRALQPKNLSRSSIQSIAYHNWLKAKLDSDFLMIQPLVVMVGEAVSSLPVAHCFLGHIIFSSQS